MVKYRAEVLIFDIVLIASILLWLFIPVYELKSIDYEQMITPLGFQIDFFRASYLLMSPLPILAIFFFIVSAALPLLWKSSRYSLYASTVSAGFGIVMIINSIIFDARYLHYYGYSILPTSDGSFYIFFPSITSFEFPFYFFIASTGLSVLNSVTRSRWIPYGRLTLIDKLKTELGKGEIIRGFLALFNSLGVEYAVVNDSHLRVRDLSLLEEDEKNKRLSLFFDSGEKIIFSKNSDKVIYKDAEGEIRYYNLENGIKLALSKILEQINFNTKDTIKTNDELYN
ncbi:hypothetical protein DFR86_10645 [Acidianus sulfidivorans JP7]|uniref:Uncharacterized protein n=1 Tax=Acidianus sulfidivorans JP7 TaxID=619593 RepID=A0A2U9IPN7_9CREN|nr:hypothetical protein [Acidianus sulfidivorans]AWR97947.1 hypothetical protein DFR86_10645 [Acidianus sulfidivorans JP7]